MNSTTLGYSFVDENEEKRLNDVNRAVSTSQILNKLKSSTKNEKILEQRQKKNTNITAFSDDDESEYINNENNSDNNKHINPLINGSEGFSNYDMSEMNKGHYTTEVSPNVQQTNSLYDFGRHINHNYSNTEYQGVDRMTHEKINYIIHMLEQNRQLRTENITEEMIMYFFLGFFVLYISENFVKMGKYTR
jgi:hypothetical protein